MNVYFEIPGEPQGKGRPRFTKVGGYVKTYTPEKTASYENLVKMEYQMKYHGQQFEDIPLAMEIKAFYGIPKSVSKKKRDMMLMHLIRPTKKPDMDNVVKVIADSLNNLAYRDDTQIVECTVRKFYSVDPRVEVIIKEAE